VFLGLTVDECLKYFEAVVTDPSSVAPWADWWRLNSESVRSNFSRDDYLRLKFRTVEAACSILIERGLIRESVISPHLEELTAKNGDLLSGFPGLKLYFSNVVGSDSQNRLDVEVNLLTFERCVELTEDFATFHPLFQAPGLVQFLILDDANTSDHHCFVFDLPIAGSILFLPHDNEMRIAFRNLDDFSDAIQSAIRTGRRLSDFHTQDTLLGLDQSVLNATIRRGLESSDFVPVSLLIQASDLRDLDLFLSIVGHPDWAYAEQIANRIIAKPELHMRRIAEEIAKHKLDRVSERGNQAISSIAALTGH
jgi:hypothetical protein